MSVFGNHKSCGTAWYLEFRYNHKHELDQLVEPFQFPILFLFPNHSAFDTAIYIYDGRVFWPMSSGFYHTACVNMATYLIFHHLNVTICSQNFFQFVAFHLLWFQDHNWQCCILSTICERNQNQDFVCVLVKSIRWADYWKLELMLIQTKL